MGDDLEKLDFFADAALVADPYPYYDQLRKCPVPPRAPTRRRDGVRLRRGLGGLSLTTGRTSPPAMS